MAARRSRGDGGLSWDESLWWGYHDLNWDLFLIRVSAFLIQ